METRLEEIKKLHEEAVKSSQIAFDTGSCAEEDNVKDILNDLFQKQHTDWLIEQAEKVERLEKRNSRYADKILRLKEQLKEIKEVYIYGQPSHDGEVMVETEETCDAMYQIAVDATEDGE